jgi:hypothetical protein
MTHCIDQTIDMATVMGPYAPHLTLGGLPGQVDLSAI